MYPITCNHKFKFKLKVPGNVQVNIGSNINVDISINVNAYLFEYLSVNQSAQSGVNLSKKWNINFIITK